MSFCGVVRDIVLMGANPIKDARRKEIRPHRRCSGRDHPDGINNKVQVYLGGVTFFCQNPQFLIGRDALLQKTLFFTIFFWTSSCMRPPGTGKTKMKKERGFLFFVFDFRFWNAFFFDVSCREAGKTIFVISELFGNGFCRFCWAETLVFTVFLSVA